MSTMERTSPTRNARRWTWVARAVLAVVGAIAGAVWDWYNWHPMSAVVMTLVAASLLLVGGALLAIRARWTRRVGPFVLALGLGIVAGQVLGPDRAPLDGKTGTISITTDSPTVATGTASAFCSSDRDGQFQVSGDANLRLGLFDDDPTAPADLDQRAFVQISITNGDRWRNGGIERSDDLQLQIRIGPVTAGAETVMLATDASTVDLQGTAQSGSLRFADLAHRTGPDGAGGPIDIAGTLTWTC